MDSIHQEAQALRRESAEMRRRLRLVIEKSRRQCQASKTIRDHVILPAATASQEYLCSLGWVTLS